MINAPSGGAPEKARRWDLLGTEASGGGTLDLLCSPKFLGYMGIYRRKKYVSGSPGCPRGRGRAQGGGRAPYLVASSKLPWLLLQAPWIASVPKITLPKVSFRLDSV